MREQIQILRSGAGLHVLAAGPVGGRTVVMIHGLGWDAASLWEAQIGMLAAAGWRVLAPDLRGTGGSPPLRGAVGIAGLADDVAALIADEVAAAPVLVGFSMGAMVAVDLALRPGTRPAGLVLACGGVASSPGGEAGVTAMLARAEAMGPRAFAEEQAQMIFAPDWAARNGSAVAAFIERRAVMDQDSLHHSFRAPFGCDYTGQLARITCPAHVIAAGQDNFLSVADCRALARALPQAELTVIEESGHMAPVEAPGAFNAALLSYLEQLKAPAA
ncbi:MAG: alpha/beta hydrolase [Rubellimicrobium sp.]|nr:alpha/beta hydrolase [Rubellimicrobium sp.]